MLYDLKKELEKKQKKNKDLLNDQESSDLLASKRESTIKDLAERVSQLELSLEKEYSENSELKVSVEEKEMCLQQQNATLSDYKTKLDNIQQNSEMMQSAAKENQKEESESIKQEMKEKEEKLIKLQTEVKKLEKLCRAKDAKLAKRTEESKSQCDSLLEEKTLTLEKTLNALQLERDGLVSEMQKIQKMYKGREIKIKKLEELISEQERHLSEYEAESIILKESVNELNEKVEDARYEEQCAQKDLQRMMIEQENTMESVEQLQQSIGNTNKENTALKQQIQELKEGYQISIESVRILENKNTDLDLITKKKDEEIHRLTAHLLGVEEDQQKTVSESKKLSLVTKGKDAKVKKLEEMLKRKDEELEVLNIQLREASRLYESEIKKDESKSQEILRLQKLGKGKEAKAKKFEDVVSLQEKLLAEKETDSVILQGKISEMSIKINALESEEVHLRKELEDSFKEIEELKHTCKDFEKRELDLNQNIKMKNEEIEKLNADFKTSKENFNSLLLEKRDLEKQIVDVQNIMSQTERKLCTVEQEVVRLNEELEKVKKDKDAISFEREKMKMIEKGKKSKLNKFQEVVEKQENILTEKETDLLMMKERINDLSERLSQKEEEIEILKSDLDRSCQFEELCKQHELTISDIQQDFEEKSKDYLEDCMNNERKISSLEEKCAALENTVEFLQRQEKDMELDIQSLSASASETDYWRNRCQKFEENNAGISVMPVVSDIIEPQNNSISFCTNQNEESSKSELIKPCSESNLSALLEEKQALILSMQDNHQKELSALNAKLSKMKTLCKAKDAKLAKLQNSSKEEENKIEESGSSATMGSVDNLSFNSSGIDSEWKERIVHSEVVMQLEREIEDLKDVIQSRDEEIVDGRNFAVNQQEELQTLRDYLHSKEAEIFDLKERIYGWEDWYEKEFRNIEASLQTLEDTVAEKDNVIADLKEELESIKETSLHDNAVVLQANENVTHKSLEQELSKVKRLCKGKEAKIKQLEQTKKDLEEKFQKFEEESNRQIEWRQLVDDNQTENQNLRQHIETSNTEHLQRIKDFESMLTKQTNQILALKQNYIDLENKCRKLEEGSELVAIELSMFKKEVFEVIKEEQEFVYHEALESASSPVAVLSMIRKEFSHLRQSFDENFGKLKEKDLCIASLQETNESTMKKMASLEDMVYSLEKVRESHLHSLEEKETTIKSLNTQLTALQSDEDVKKTICSLEGQIARLKDNLSRQGNEMQNIQMLFNSQGEELEGTLKALDEARNVRSSKMEEQDLAITHLRKRLHEEEEKCRQLSASLEVNQQSIAELQQTVQSLTEANQAWQYYYQEKENEVHLVNQRCSDLQTYCTQKDDIIAALEEKSKTILSQKNNDETALKEFNDSLLGEIEQLKQVIESSKGERKESVSRVQSLENENSRLNEEIVRKKEELLQERTAKTELENTIVMLNSKFEEQNQHVIALEKASVDISASLQEKNCQIETLTSNYIQSQDLIKQHQQKAVEYEQLLSKSETNVKEMEKETTSLKKSLRQGHEELSRMKEDFEKEKRQLLAHLDEKENQLIHLQKSNDFMEREMQELKKESHNITNVVNEPIIQKHQERLLGAAPSTSVMEMETTESKNDVRTCSGTARLITLSSPAFCWCI